MLPDVSSALESLLTRLDMRATDGDQAPGDRVHRSPQRQDQMFQRLGLVSAKGEPFTLTSILKEEPPGGTDGSDWHRYVITQGGNTIVGHRQGNLESVTVAVEEIVEGLNERRLHKRERVHLIPPPSKRSPT